MSSATNSQPSSSTHSGLSALLSENSPPGTASGSRGRSHASSSSDVIWSSSHVREHLRRAGVDAAGFDVHDLAAGGAIHAIEPLVDRDRIPRPLLCALAP